ncbi:MAG TPA: hypothetical protein DD001_22030 [Microcoleaceae bacterium UBA10368]|jgi:hypothetical protein|nr:hypothetical protein [Microcoleaceae cyanobacterium UBA10368]HCV31306.1 hypothetical protein [Microcoleaceae cyanobacterium UBA9251]
MKGRSLLGLIMSLTILCTCSLAVFANSDRYPTDAELKKLRLDFEKQIDSFQKTSRKDTSEINQLRAFRSAWSKVDPGVVPFLGAYRALEEGKFIYPSNTKGRVCIIDTYLMGRGGSTAESNGILFTVGSVSNGTIRTTNNHVFIQKGDYLGDTYVQKDEARLYGYNLIGSLKPPSVTHIPGFNINYLPDWVKQEIIQKFKEAGCTASLPNRR